MRVRSAFRNARLLPLILLPALLVSLSDSKAQEGGCSDRYKALLKNAVVSAYTPPDATSANPAVKAFWGARFGLEFRNLQPGQNIASVHLSRKDLALDAILSLSREEDGVLIRGKLGGLEASGRLLQRNVNGGSPPRLAILAEEEVGDPAFLRNTLAELLGKSAAETPVLILRRPDSTSGTYLSRDLPLVFESLELDAAGGRLSSPLTVTVARPEIISRLTWASSYRNHWTPQENQGELKKALLSMAKRKNPGRRAVVLDAGAASEGLPSLRRDFVLSDTLEDLGDFRYRDKEGTLDLGVGQPHIQLSPEIQAVGRADLSRVDKEKLASDLEAELRKWYRQRYQAELPNTRIALTSGSTSAIEEIFSRIPEGSTIYLPESSYSSLQRAAAMQGLKVRNYSPFDDSILRLPMDPSVKLVVTNYPHNPGGKTMDEAIRARLHGYAKGGALVYNDLSYTRFGYDGHQVSSLFTGATDTKNLVESFSGSKDIGLPGNRLSAVVGDADFVGSLRSSPFHDEDAISKKRIRLLTEVLRRPELTLTTQEEMQARKDAVVKAFREIGWPEGMISRPEGGLNVMLQVPEGVDPNDLVRLFWKEAKVFVAPDDWFGRGGGKRFLRVSLSETSERLGGLDDRLKKSGISFSGIRNALLHPSQQGSAARKGGAWTGSVLGAPRAFDSPAQAADFVARVFKDRKLLGELERETDRLGGISSGRLWDRYFESYDRLVMHDPGYLELMDEMNASLHPEGLTVDLGSGTGNFAVAAAAHSPGRRVLGIDLSEAGVRLGREKAGSVPGTAGAGNLEFRQGDMLNPGLPAGSVRNAVVINAFYTLKDKGAFFGKLREMLADDGAVFLHDFFVARKGFRVPENLVRQGIARELSQAVAAGAQLTQYDAALLAYMNAKRISSDAEKWLTLEEFKAEAERYGFSVESAKPTHYLGGTALVLRKKGYAAVKGR